MSTRPPEPSAPLTTGVRRLGPVARFFVYGLIGLCVEFLFTSIVDLVAGQGDLRLRGYSYIWMVPIWGAGVLFGEWLCLVQLRARIGRCVRGLVYMAVCFTIEYAAGALLMS